MSVPNTHFGAENIKRMLDGKKSIFFVGVGGINMSSLAHISYVRGMKVGGSDRTCSVLTQRLESEGIEIFYSHDASHLDTYEALVYTVAISEDNPEYLEANRRGLPCISRADYMGYLMTDYKNRIGISGMHGKSTCTSMCAEVLLSAQADPTILSGAETSGMGGAYRVGGKENFLFEACEYMDSFLDFNPTVSVILNIEMDHVDYFTSMEQIKTSFLNFANLAICGACVANADDTNVVDALSEYHGDILWYGVNDMSVDIRGANIEKVNGCYAFDILRRGELMCHVRLGTGGYHNVYNALACASALYYVGISWSDIKRGLESFSGAMRRMEYKGMQNGARVFDDYGHHPTEVKTTLEGARDMAVGKLFCVFQSHTYSRTAALLEDFAKALSIADRVIITDIYAARETDTRGITPEILAQMIGDNAVAVHSFEDAAQILRSELCRDDLAVVMGAGDVWRTFEYLDLKRG